MAVSSYNAIGSVTLSSAQLTVTFSNIPQIYTDLVVVSSLVATSATLQNAPQLRINGDTGSNYSATALNGNGSSAGSGRWSNQTVIYADYYGILQNDGIGMMTANFMNYTNTTAYKTVLVRSGKGNKETTATVGLWRKTDAINSIQLITDSPNTFAAGSTFSLYGIGANQLKASGGDVIVSDGSYWYHAFKSSGTFTPTSALTCDILRISGGGGGGFNLAGGAGAGGIVLSSAQSLTASAYTATIGAGGTGSTSSGVIGGIGTSTTFTGSGLSLSTVFPGGGGKGDYGATYASASIVASNGGASGALSGSAGGTTSTGQGNAGGTAGTAGYNAGGGGGAGAVGASGSNSVSGVGGAGGAGINSYSSWATITGTGVSGFYAGGGGGSGMKTTLGTGAIGGLGGSGGGGQGGSDNGVSGANHMLAMAAIPNTGSGGGGGGWDQYNALHANGANGGSGLVIVRYSV
jgi:hypothetical protein